MSVYDRLCNRRVSRIYRDLSKLRGDLLLGSVTLNANNPLQNLQPEVERCIRALAESCSALSRLAASLEREEALRE